MGSETCRGPGSLQMHPHPWIWACFWEDILRALAPGWADLKEGPGFGTDREAGLLPPTRCHPDSLFLSCREPLPGAIPKAGSPTPAEQLPSSSPGPVMGGQARWHPWREELSCSSPEFPRRSVRGEWDPVSAWLSSAGPEGACGSWDSPGGHAAAAPSSRQCPCVYILFHFRKKSSDQNQHENCYCSLGGKYAFLLHQSVHEKSNPEAAGWHQRDSKCSRQNPLCRLSQCSARQAHTDGTSRRCLFSLLSFH